MKNNGPLQLMFLGTGSDVGKSILVAGFCRILRRAGYRVVPFKAQNMALNSSVTMDGKEMGQAQVMQAMAAGIPPEADMNPVLLKPTGDSNSQVILQGKLLKTESAKGYYTLKELLLPRVIESYERLIRRFDAIVLEGAGSTVEMNLKDRDFVNIEMAMCVHAPVVLVADIDRGGVFGAIIGTMKLLTYREKRLILGFIINKFRGDPSLFQDGIKFIEKKTRRRVFGVLPYFDDIHLPEEDSVALHQGRKGKVEDGKCVRVSIVHLPYISNYTDFDPLELEEGVSLRYVRSPDDLEKSDAIILPGTKNTVADLLWLKERGFERELRRHVERGKTLIGICGGYQMLGNQIEDPDGVETIYRKTRGLGFLNVRTTLQNEKTLKRVRGVCLLNSIKGIDGEEIEVEGYEIHMGVTLRAPGVRPSFMLKNIHESLEFPGEVERKHYPEPEPLKKDQYCETGLPEGVNYHEDGATTPDEKVWGTYIHGIFENDVFRYQVLSSLGRGKEKALVYRSYLDSQFDRLADLVEKHIDVRSIIKMAEKFRCRRSGLF